MELSYIAGFLDGDGSIYAQIVKRSDYQLRFQLRVSVSFFQKTTRHWFLIQLKNQLRYGSLRKNPSSGMSDYTIVGNEAVKHCLEGLLPYLKMKKPSKALEYVVDPWYRAESLLPAVPMVAYWRHFPELALKDWPFFSKLLAGGCAWDLYGALLVMNSISMSWANILKLKM